MDTLVADSIVIVVVGSSGGHIAGVCPRGGNRGGDPCDNHDDRSGFSVETRTLYGIVHLDVQSGLAQHR